MSLDGGLPTKAPVGDALDQPKQLRDGPVRAALVFLIAVQLAWVAALAYGMHRAVQLIG
jgi:hypothetical protein